MSGDRSLERAIEIASSMKQGLTLLIQDYESLPKILNTEIDAVRKSEMQVLEETSVQKVQISDHITETIAEMRIHCAALVEQHTLICGNSAAALTTHDLSISHGLDLLIDIVGACNDELASQVLSHQMQGLEQQIKKFRQLRADIQPIVEKNHLLVAKMTQSVQESFRFWQAIAEEAQAPYTSTGKKATQEGQPAFKVTA